MATAYDRPAGAPQHETAAPGEADTAPPATMFIFGASGDLTRRLLLPALYNLVVEKLLDPGFAIVGIDHVAHTDEDFRAYLDSVVPNQIAGHVNAPEVLDGAAWNWLSSRCGYIAGDFEDAATYRAIAERLEQSRDRQGHANAVFYLAVAPRFFGPVVEHLGAAGLLNESDGRGFRRIIIEKPFGTDVESAHELDAILLREAGEKQIYRIDHFLGKETVQNVMALRFGNGIFEPIWSREYIDHVQITAAETVTVQSRGRFYDATGALRDMVPNHMFQLLAMTAMEPPNSFAADAVRTEKAKVIEAIRRHSPAEAARWSVRGQYRAGTVKGQPVADFLTEPFVAPDSRTETYVALKCMIDNWRWSGVPFFIRTGKALSVRRTEIAIQFKRAPSVLFRDTPTGALEPNLLIIHVQPNEGVSLRFAAKVPGRKVRLSKVDMDFRYSDYFRAEPSTGYETLIFDCLIGDATLFQRADNIEAGWGAVQSLIEATAQGLCDVHPYVAGTSGPEAADELIGRDGFSWLPLTGRP